jgi:hypothetical protein
MKTLAFKLMIALIMFLGANVAKANYIKEIHKSWGIDQVEALKIENKFGNINFINTRSDSVTIDVSIKISEKNGEYLADQIEFHFSLSNGTIKAITEFGDKFKTNQEFTIVYKINIPIDRHLDVENKYGDVTLGDLKANGKFDLKYGNIQGQNLEAPNDNSIELELKYGNATFVAINQLKAVIAYGKFSAESITTAQLDTQYSLIKIDQTENTNIESKYDNFEFDKVNKIDAESKFTGWDISELKESFIINTQYGNINIDRVNPDFKQINIENSYGNIKIGIPESASYHLESDSYYCKVYHSPAEIIKQIEDNNHTYIKANVGENTGTAIVKIKSKYGKVNLKD